MRAAPCRRSGRWVDHAAPGAVGASTAGSSSSADLAQHVEVRAEAGAGDDLVDRAAALPSRVVHDDARRGALERVDLHAGGELDDALVDERLDAPAERAAGRQGVVLAAAEQPVDRPAAPHGPDDARSSGASWCRATSASQRVHRRVAAPDHEHALAGVARALGAARRGCRRRCARPARARRPRAGRRRRAGWASAYVPLASMTAWASIALPRASRADDAARTAPSSRSVSLSLSRSRRVTASTSRAEADAVAQLWRRGQRQQVVLAQLGAGRVLVVRSGAASRSAASSPLGGAIDDVAPRREQRHVAPVGDGRRRLVAALEHERLEAALEEMRCGGEADRAGADDDDGKGLDLALRHDGLLTSVNFD